MNLIQARIQSALPSRRKKTPAGWEAFNSICCHHRGHRADRKRRGGVMFTSNGFTYSCFNCQFKAGWTLGHLLSKNTRSLMSWLNISDDEIKKLALEAVRQKDESTFVDKKLSFDLEPKSLPNNCKTIKQWLEEGCQDLALLEVIDYLFERGLQLDWYDWMWSAEAGYRDRVVIPYYFEGQIVGWTARLIRNSTPKYITKSQPGIVFNLDEQTNDRQFVIVVEGPIDAITIGGVAITHNDPGEVQISRINSLGREVIVVPDRDEAGTTMIDAAIEQNWSVSLPDWGNDVKDVADAVKKYGKIYTLFTILKYREHGEIKLTIAKRKIINATKERTNNKL
jgi:hypothetical protein